MTTLLFIGSDPGVAAAVRDMAELCGVRLVQAKTCAVAWRLMEQPTAFDAVVIELWPWLSRLVLLAELNERFGDLPIVAIRASDEACKKVLIEAYGARAVMPKAHLDAAGLAQSFGWSTHSAPPARCFPPAKGENVTGGRKSLGASPTPASRPSRAAGIGSRELFRCPGFYTNSKGRKPTRSQSHNTSNTTYD